MTTNIFFAISLCLSLCWASTLDAAPKNPLQVVLSRDNFIVTNGKTSLVSGSISLRSEGITYRYPPSAVSKGELPLVVGPSNSLDFLNGVDPKFGNYKYNTRSWIAGKSSFNTTIKVFSDSPMILFEQDFPDKVSGTQSHSEPTLSTFPSFSLSGGSMPKLGYTYFHNLWDMGSYGVGINQNFKGGIKGGSPLFLFDKELNALVLSPFQNFKVGVQAVASGELRCGIEALVKEVSPAKFKHTTILYAGQGINDTVYGWGSTLLKRTGKPQFPHSQKDDMTTKYLGYWTDNGAYYYYKTEDGKNYEQTVKDVVDWFKRDKIPVKTFQLDSWWYFKGKGDGVKEWAPRPDIFPNGLVKLQEEVLKMPLTLHNRWWTNDNVYEKKFPFYNESPKYSLPSGSAAQQEEFFFSLFESTKGWGLSVYEQDWLIDQFSNMNYTRENLHVGQNWLTSMGNAAKRAKLNIQYCMPLPADFMQSTESLAVSQMRVSDDNYPGSPNWRLGVPSMISWSLGVAPFKDVFWTTSIQEGNGYNKGFGAEPNPELHSIISTLTAGPVGFGDKIGSTNTTILFRMCNTEGKLLQPTRPITALDSTYLHAFGSPYSHVYGTYSDHDSVRTWYLLSTDLKAPYTVFTKDLGLPKGTRYISYQFGSNKYSSFNDSAPFRAPVNPKSHHFWKDSKGNSNPMKYYHNYQVLSPVLNGNFVLLGEKDKWVTTSNDRFQNIRSNASSLTAKIVGGKNEIVNLSIILPSNLASITGSSPSVTKIACNISTSGIARLTCTTQSCTCA
eukprot:TRINITY_DN1833_c0_g1_i1.p1 TRINITY_DN1833_c0_g1~~TRINITY_DN1833_c0_g1_i1.p1  ORF type:complete len:782 (+),score=207.18 TRINITY_DN1833_c0_g1_i1:2854-5199(+)